MSHLETIAIAHTAQCKLRMAANKPDRNLRFLLGHALTLDNINVRLMQIEDESKIVQKPSHANSIKFKAHNNSGVKGSPLSARQKTPPPPQDLDGDDSDGASTDSDHEGPSLSRFASAAAQPPRRLSPEPAKKTEKKVDDYLSSSDDDGELESFLASLEEQLDKISLKKKITESKPDESLAHMYHNVAGCPCHKTEAPELKNFWEISSQDLGGVKGMDNMRIAVAEIMV